MKAVLNWRGGVEDGKPRHAVTFGTDELDELVERAVEENAKSGQNVYIGQALRQPNVAPFVVAVTQISSP